VKITLRSKAVTRQKSFLPDKKKKPEDFCYPFLSNRSLSGLQYKRKGKFN